MILSILIPVYNESAVVMALLEKVNAQKIDGVDFEILIIDDGSTDNTVSLLENRPDLYSDLIRLPENRGKGAAIMAGIASAKGDFILCQDADLEYDPGDYPALLFPVLNYAADIVLGSRLTAPQYTRVHYYWHKIGNRFITFVFNVLNNTTFTDIYSGYLLFRRSLIEAGSLKAQGWDQQAEILSRAVSAGKVYYEVPISYHGRTYEDGKKIKYYHAFAIIMMIVKCRFSP